MKILLVGTKLFYADRQTDRQTDRQQEQRTDMTQPTVAFLSFANVPKNVCSPTDKAAKFSKN